MAEKKFFHGDDVIDDATGWPQICPIINVWERLAPGASCKDNISSINANIVIAFLGYTSRSQQIRLSVSVNVFKINTFFRGLHIGFCINVYFGSYFLIGRLQTGVYMFKDSH